MAQSFITGGYLYLTAKLSPGGTSFIGDRDLGITLGRLKMRDPNNPDSTYTEWIQFSTVTAVGDGTFTYGGLTRQLSQTADPATSLGTGNTWVAGTEAKLVAMHDQLADKLNGSLVTVYATTAARDAAIPSPTNGMSVYVTADGVFYDYQGGAWATRGNSATANASTTVAGKVEIATGAEVTAGTSTGGTGAILAVSPDQLVQEINGSTAKTTIVDADKLPLADSAASGVRKAITWANAKVQISTDMPASETFAGLVERATDAEATAGADTTRFITAKQAKDNYNRPRFTYSSDASVLARWTTAASAGGSSAISTYGLQLATNGSGQQYASAVQTVKPQTFDSNFLSLTGSAYNVADGGINTDNQWYFGLGSVTVSAASGHTFTDQHVGFKAIYNGGVISLYGTVSGGTESVTSALITFSGVTSGFEFYVRRVDASTLEFGAQRTGTSWTTAQLTTNIPTSISNTVQCSYRCGNTAVGTTALCGYTLASL